MVRDPIRGENMANSRLLTTLGRGWDSELKGLFYAEATPPRWTRLKDNHSLRFYGGEIGDGQTGITRAP